MTFFTSDQHFRHFNIIRLSHRPFASADEMDEAMVAKWNAKVKADDTIYVLGDLFFRSANVEPILKRLNGRKHLVLGNHDHSWTGKVRLGDYFDSVQTIKEIDLGGIRRTRVVCCRGGGGPRGPRASRSPMPPGSAGWRGAVRSCRRRRARSIRQAANGCGC